MRTRELKKIKETTRLGNWETYRQKYTDFSFANKKDLAEFYDTVYPNQKHYNPVILNWVTACAAGGSVVELGSHFGELASEVLSQTGRIYSWLGYDLCQGNYSHGKYNHFSLTKPFTETIIPFSPNDVFVCSHTFEHMLIDEVIKCIHQMNRIQSMIFEIPISEDGQQWAGYNGAHVLLEGRKHIRDIMAGISYTLIKECFNNNSWQVLYKRKGEEK